MDRPPLSLIFVSVFVALVFGVRTFLLWRATGTTGFRGFSGRVGSLEWWGGMGFAVAIALVFAGPVAGALGLLRPLLSVAPIWLDVAAITAMTVGALGTWWSQSAMGESWRIGVDDEETTSLVKRGPFRWVRNPIFSFMMLSLVGLAAFLPNVATAAAVVVAALSLEVQVRLVEEPYLRRTHGDAYREYERSAGRFIPWMGRRRTG